MAQKFCANCGSPLNPETTFCTNCGAAAPEAQQPQTPPQQPQYYSAPQFVGKPRIPGRALAIAALVLGILAVIFGASGMISVIDAVSEYKELSLGGLFDKAFGEELMDEYGSAIGLGMILSILSVVFGGVSRSKGYRCKNAGLVLGIVGLAVTVVSIVFCAPYM